MLPRLHTICTACSYNFMVHTPYMNNLVVTSLLKITVEVEMILHINSYCTLYTTIHNTTLQK